MTYTGDGDMFYRSHIEPDNASYVRGCQIVRPMVSKESVMRRFDPRAEEERQCASFIAYDWRNKVVREISCAPGQTANYFTKSELPFEMSPAFFRPEVLLRYKADSDKYRLDERSISCRGAWSLQTYDVNDSGQVHTYLVYLRNLPYEEQLYWKAYNEKPKGSISRRAMKTDFEGCWDFDYNPLASLKDALHRLNSEQVPWWTLRSPKLPDQVHYPVTCSLDEWANELLQLDQLLVDGFETKWLRNWAASLGRNPDPKFGSLKLAEECLIGLGFAEEHARSVMAPLRRVHHLRSNLKGHASGTEAVAVRQQALTQFGNYNKHFRTLCGECDESLRTIIEGLKKLN